MVHSNRSQLSLYAILAVLALLAFILVSYLTERPEIVISTELSAPINSLVTDCLATTSSYGAYLIGIQGGYVNLPNDKFDMDNLSLGPFSHRGRIYAPTAQQLANDLATYIDSQIIDCVRAKTVEGIRLTITSSKTLVKINPSNVAITTDLPVEATTNKGSVKLSRFSYLLPVRLGMLRSISEGIVANKEANIGYFDLTNLTDLNHNTELRVYNRTYLVLTIFDNQSITHIEDPYRYNLVMDAIANNAPTIDMPKRFALKVGQPFSHKVDPIDPDGDPVKIRSLNPLFNIGANGEISFTPKQAGTYDITITAEDDKDARTDASSLFEVSQ